MGHYGNVKVKGDDFWCGRCKRYKNKTEFNNSALNNNFYVCKECLVKYRLKMKANINRLINNIYFHQTHTKDPVEYTWDQLSSWLVRQNSFLEIYKRWVSLDCDKKLTPAVIRINPNDAYKFDNLKFVTTEEARNLNSRKRARPIIQMDINDREIARYPNARVAAMMLNLKRYQCIHAVCKGKRKTCLGFKWRYSQ
jgi:hypothetical protein